MRIVEIRYGALERHLLLRYDSFWRVAAISRYLTDMDTLKEAYWTEAGDIALPNGLTLDADTLYAHSRPVRRPPTDAECAAVWKGDAKKAHDDWHRTFRQTGPRSWETR